MAPSVPDNTSVKASTDPLNASVYDNMSTQSQMGSVESSPARTIRRVKSSPCLRDQISSDVPFITQRAYKAHVSICKNSITQETTERSQNAEQSRDRTCDTERSPSNTRHVEEHSEDNIYNAERVSPTPTIDKENFGSILSSFPPTPKRWSNATSHSRWPEPQLGPIIEQSSVTSGRTSHSLPRPVAIPTATQPTQAPWAIRADVPTVLLDPTSGSEETSIPAPNILGERGGFSASSESAAGPSTPYSSYPRMPMQSPPGSIETPPGLPSFGTREATTWRLRQGPLIRQILYHFVPYSDPSLDDRNYDEDPMPRHPALDGTGAIPLRNRNRQDQSGPSSTEAVTRTLAVEGLSRLLSTAPEQVDLPRASMPFRLYTSNVPGSLALADDGTHIRGEFGSRTSGHGVGRRQLECHPFGQANDVGEIVQEIDKACERVDMERLESQTVTPYAPTQGFGRISVTDSPDVSPGVATQQVSSDEGAGQAQPSPATTPSPPASMDANVEDELRAAIAHVLPHLMYSHTQSRMLHASETRLARPQLIRFSAYSPNSVAEPRPAFEQPRPYQENTEGGHIARNEGRKGRWWAPMTAWLKESSCGLHTCTWPRSRRSRMYSAPTGEYATA
ncbi:hypothetical protein PV08_07012 [Exophiala spinifera]|uniref:Uncharacterized protein n=1 Tax=Exophiala spinifera TaxID=91928 RepID=A0A0D2B6B0_9EURO|nr:uncharacterized protein PV08_07012 [Exophiala spinifera]KIW14230.1 hypothetical protein PV08_07012 [Exophiala spinifera]